MPRMRVDGAGGTPHDRKLAGFDVGEVNEAIEENTKNSKFRLYRLEKQFNQQKTKSKDKIDQMQRKIE